MASEQYRSDGLGARRAGSLRGVLAVLSGTSRVSGSISGGCRRIDSGRVCERDNMKLQQPFQRPISKLIMSVDPTRTLTQHSGDKIDGYNVSESSVITALL